MKVIDPQKLEHYRVAAMIGQRLAGVKPHTVHVVPDDLAALVDRYTDGLVDEVKIAMAGQCSCHGAGCLHDRIRAAAGDAAALREQLQEATTLPHPAGALARARVRAWSLQRDIGAVRKIIGLARTLGPENVGVAELLDQLDAATSDKGVEEVARVH